MELDIRAQADGEQSTADVEQSAGRCRASIQGRREQENREMERKSRWRGRARAQGYGEQSSGRSLDDAPIARQSWRALESSKGPRLSSA